MPPFLLIHGTKDEDVPYEQSVEMREKARTAGGHCDVIPVDGAPHGMDHWESRAELLWYKKARTDRKSTRLNSSHGYISYAVFCLKKKNNQSPNRCITHTRS